MLIGQPAMRPQRWGDQRVLIGRGDGKAPDRVVRGCWLSGCSVGADCRGPSVCIGWVPVGVAVGAHGCQHCVLHMGVDIGYSTSADVRCSLGTVTGCS